MLRARFLVDASGRDSFLATTIGRRDRVPNLGEAPVFAYHQSAARASGLDEGDIRVRVFRAERMKFETERSGGRGEPGRSSR